MKPNENVLLSRKILILLLIFATAVTAISCDRIKPSLFPTDEPTGAAAEDPIQTEIDAADTAEKLRALFEAYQKDKNYEAAYRAAKKLTQLDPSDIKACTDAADALLALTKTNYARIDQLLQQGCENAAEEDAESIVLWAEENDPHLLLSLPFTPDYKPGDPLNTDGISSGNLSNALKINGDWRGGFMTEQAGWVYFSRIDENLALYKMRANGESLTKIGNERGYSVNVVGDWIYYINLADSDRPYKIRTDGSQKTRLSDETCGFLTVSDDWIYYDSATLCRMRTDGSELVKLTELTAIFPCAAEGFVYYSEKSMEGGLYQMSADGMTKKKLVPGFIQTYCVSGDWVYYLDSANLNAIRRVGTDGSGDTEVFRDERRIASFNITGGTLIVSVGKAAEDDGILIGSALLEVDAETGEIRQEYDEQTDPVLVADGWFYYTEYREGMTWHGVDPATDSTIIVE